MFQWILGYFYKSSDKRRKSFFDACRVSSETREYFEKSGNWIKSYNYTPRSNGPDIDITLFNCPSFWKEHSLWIIGGFSDDEMITICCDSEGVYSIYESMSGDITRETLESSIDVFLTRCKPRG